MQRKTNGTLKTKSPRVSLPGRSLYIHRWTDHYFPRGQTLFLNLGFGYSFQTNNYCFSIHFQKTDHPQIKGQRRGHNEAVVLPLHFQFCDLIGISENDSEMSKMNHEVISEHEMELSILSKVGVWQILILMLETVIMIG